MTDRVEIYSSKSDFIIETILLILYSLLFIFLTFVLYKVNKTRRNSHRCTINLMLVCLLLAVMSKFFFTYIINSFIF